MLVTESGLVNEDQHGPPRDSAAPLRLLLFVTYVDYLATSPICRRQRNLSCFTHIGICTGPFFERSGILSLPDTWPGINSERLTAKEMRQDLIAKR